MTGISDDTLVDEFGQTLEEQLQTQILHEYWIDRTRHDSGEYQSSVQHLDGEQLPYGLQVIYQDGGPQFSVESYLPEWHYGKAVQLLDEGYESFLTYFNLGPEKDKLTADGGPHQIENPQPDTVWFWYDPTTDRVIQEEVDPYNVVGLFETKEDAEHFMDWYGDHYDLEEATHFELYRADLEYIDNGPPLGQESEENDEHEKEELAEQAGVTQFHEEDR